MLLSKVASSSPVGIQNNKAAPLMKIIPLPTKKKKKKKRSEPFFVHGRSERRRTEQETEVYLHEGQTEELPLEYWARKSPDFSILFQVAQKVFVISTTLAKVEWVFSMAGKILGMDRHRLLPRSL